MAGHHHDHHNHSHHVGPASTGSAFMFSVAINLVYTVVEVFAGTVAHSLALLTDAAHNASDVAGLLGAWVASRLAVRAASDVYTYGMRRASILSALGNAVVLLIVTGGIAWEAVLRFFAMPHVGGLTVMVVAAGGVLVNGGSALLFLHQRKELNARGAFLHLAGDAGLAGAAVLAGSVIALTHWNWIDPATSLLVAGIIMMTTWSLLRQSVAMALDAVPQGLDVAKISSRLGAIPGVISLHDLHVWSVSTTETALTAHIVRADPADDTRLLSAAQSTLLETFGISHATIQFESSSAGCACVFT